MEYVYDIVLNLQPTYYEFYEWQPTDKIINIKRLPIYKITNQDYLNIKNNNVIIDRKMLPKTNKLFLITSGLEITGIMIDDYGQVVKKSSLLFEENDDILEDKDEIKSIKIKYKIVKRDNDKPRCRMKLEKQNYLNKYLGNLDKKKDKYFLKYLYFEIYEIDESNIDKIYTDLIKLSNDNPMELYDILNKVNIELKRKNLSS